MLEMKKMMNFQLISKWANQEETVSAADKNEVQIFVSNKEK